MKKVMEVVRYSDRLSLSHRLLLFGSDKYVFSFIPFLNLIVSLDFDFNQCMHMDVVATLQFSAI